MKKRATYTRQADILANVSVSSDPAVMCIDQLAPVIRAQIYAARLKGFRPVSLSWRTGEFALTTCVPGSDMPSVEKILEAYYQCRRTNKIFPEGIQK